MNTQAKFLFRDYGITAEEVINTLSDAIEANDSDLADRLTDVKELLKVLWEV